MNLDDLHIFCSVVREGGIARAAIRLHRVPSNVTTRMKQFEERLGVALFRRQGRGLVLTESGRILLGHAERLLQMADVAEEEVRSGVARGTSPISGNWSATSAVMPVHTRSTGRWATPGTTAAAAAILPASEVNSNSGLRSRSTMPCCWCRRAGQPPPISTLP